MKKIFALLLLCSNLSLLQSQTPKQLEGETIQKLNLHVPSPEWQDQIIYFLMIDRFNDGNESNNKQGEEEFDPKDSRKFSGGDLEGIIQKLDYIQELGATTVWITPPVANQWWDASIQYGGYHGYWAEHFKKIDAHFGSLENYKQLSHHLHERGMYLIQDIVVNHTGNFFEYKGEYDAKNPSQNYTLNEGSSPVKKPSQYPFNLNDPNDPAAIESDIYNWTPSISNYSDPHQKLYYQMAGLDDLNTENVVVRDVLRDAFGYWVRIVGVDGFRIDTIIYVEMDYWPDFMNSMSEKAPGINKVAAATGRDNFLAFGETFIKSEPLQNDGDIEVAKYLGTKENPALNSMLNYPLYYTINRVFTQGLPTHYMGYRLNTAVNGGIYKNPYIVANFIDNHDWSRFISNSTPVALKQALVLLFTIPGIPVIYQGTEQLFTETRTSMFAKGWGSENKDHFDTSSELFLFIKNLADIRTKNKLFTRGDLKILQDSEVGSGILAYSRKYENEEAIIIFNTADYAILAGNISTGLPKGTKLKLLSGLQLHENLTVQKDGKLNLEMPPRSAGIFIVNKEIITQKEETLAAEISNRLDENIYKSDIVLHGKASDVSQKYKIVIDGNINQALAIHPDNKGNWQLTIPISRFPFGISQHSLLLYSPTQKTVSPSKKFKTKVKIQGSIITVNDPENDDYGPFKKYIKPTDKSYKGQMDLKTVKLTSFGGNLQIEISTKDLTSVWLPPNGFDHVSFHVFIDLPEQSGEKKLPQINANAPEGFEWNYVFYMAGWNKVLYSAKGATTENYGTIITPTPKVSATAAEQKISIQFPPGVLGNIEDLTGTKIYITTWDGMGSEGGHRSISKKGAPFEFGGTDNKNTPLIMDDTKIITIPKK